MRLIGPISKEAFKKTTMDDIIGLNVHVDTFEGMKNGVPRLLDLFHRHKLQTTFFVPMGKDHTGWTVLRALRHPGLLLKARRGSAVSAYGVTTLMRGILLPGPEIARKNRDLLRKIPEMGHELGIHGLDHVYWHDHIRSMGQEQTDGILQKASTVFHEFVGSEPLAFAAPGWMINPHALAFFEARNFSYSTDTRGRTPFFPRMGGRVFRVLQIPLTLPTLDEMVGLEGNDQIALARYFCDRLAPGLNVFAAHTEFEGNRWLDFLESFIQTALGRGYRFQTLANIASTLKEKGEVIPACDCLYGRVRGRAAEVTVQGPTVA
jgi:undecaprenyl phosphate-alpha-L-ara4FN deformylase